MQTFLEIKQEPNSFSYTRDYQMNLSINYDDLLLVQDAMRSKKILTKEEIIRIKCLFIDFFNLSPATIETARIAYSKAQIGNNYYFEIVLLNKLGQIIESKKKIRRRWKSIPIKITFSHLNEEILKHPEYKINYYQAILDLKSPTGKLIWIIFQDNAISVPPKKLKFVVIGNKIRIFQINDHSNMIDRQLWIDWKQEFNFDHEFISYFNGTKEIVKLSDIIDTFEYPKNIFIKTPNPLAKLINSINNQLIKVTGAPFVSKNNIILELLQNGTLQVQVMVKGKKEILINGDGNIIEFSSDKPLLIYFKEWKKEVVIPFSDILEDYNSLYKKTVNDKTVTVASDGTIYVGTRTTNGEGKLNDSVYSLPTVGNDTFEYTKNIVTKIPNPLAKLINSINNQLIKVAGAPFVSKNNIILELLQNGTLQVQVMVKGKKEILINGDGNIIEFSSDKPLLIYSKEWKKEVVIPFSDILEDYNSLYKKTVNVETVTVASTTLKFSNDLFKNQLEVFNSLQPFNYSGRNSVLPFVESNGINITRINYGYSNLVGSGYSQRINSASARIASDGNNYIGNVVPIVLGYVSVGFIGTAFYKWWNKDTKKEVNVEHELQLLKENKQSSSQTLDV